MRVLAGWRMWLVVLAAASLAPAVARAELRKFDLNIEEVDLEVAPGFKTKVWAFNRQVPGPLIHVKEGDQVEITVHNKSTMGHTVHFHGIYQSNTWESDGSLNATQRNILPGDSFTHRFVADKVGSLWYHCHSNVAEHVAIRGMFGPFVVDPKRPSKLEREVTKDSILMFSGWNARVAAKYGEGMKPGEALNYFSINGKSMPNNQPLRVRKGDVLRMRLYAATIPVAFHLHGHDFLVTHKDGRPLDHPYYADVIGMQEGERIDVIVRMNNPGIWMSHDHIDHHTTNNGTEHGGSMMVVEYEEVEKPSFYMWKNVKYQPDYYMSESLKKPYGVHEIEALRGFDPSAAALPPGPGAPSPAEHNHSHE